MNEKIKELALKNVQQLDWDPPSEPKEYTFTDKGLNQFAELIVRECAGIYDKIDNGNKHMGTEDYLKALDRHFGITQHVRTPR